MALLPDWLTDLFPRRRPKPRCPKCRANKWDRWSEERWTCNRCGATVTSPALLVATDDHTYHSIYSAPKKQKQK